MEEKPMMWKEFVELHKKKQIHTAQDRLKKYGVLLMPDDVISFENEQRKQIRKMLKEKFNEILEEDFGEI